MKRLLALDAFRGIAAMIVVSIHAKSLGFYVDNGYLAVDFFFVLSGFILNYVYFTTWSEKGVTVSYFLRQRIARLYPLHLFMVITLALCFVIFNKHGSAASQLPIEILSNLSLLFMGGFDTNIINPPAWSISTEFIVNVLFVIFLLDKKSLHLPIAIISYLVIYSMNIGSAAIHEKVFGILNLGMLRTIAGFLLGVALYDLYRNTEKSFSEQIKPALASALEVLIILTISLSIYLHDDISRASFIFPLQFCALVYVFAFEKGIISQFLIRTRLYHLGTISYSIYMLLFNLHDPLYMGILYRRFL